MKNKLIVLLLLGSLCSARHLRAELRSLPNVDWTATIDWVRVSGEPLMRLMGVSHGDPQCKCTSWKFPGSIMLNGAKVSVSRPSGKPAFSLVDDNGTAVAAGVFKECGNEETARLETFASFAPTSGSTAFLQTIANSLVVTNLCDNTLLVDRPSGPNGAGGDCWLVHKNLVLKLSAATNRLDLAVSLLNAGLPGGERLNVGQHNVPICEGDR